MINLKPIGYLLHSCSYTTLTTASAPTFVNFVLTSRPVYRSMLRLLMYVQINVVQQHRLL